MSRAIQSDAVLPDVTVTTDGASTVAYNSTKDSFKTRIMLDCHMFSFLQRGEKSVSYAGGAVKIGASHFMFLPSGNCLMSEKTADNGEYRSRILFCGHELLASFFYQNFIAAPADPADKINRKPIAIAYDPFLQGFVDSLALLDHAGESVAAGMLKVKVPELLLYLCTRYPQLAGYFKGFASDLAAESELRKAVFANIEGAITIPELAFLCNMSLSTFKRKFASVFGTSPKQWFLKQKMERAAVLLKAEGMKASDIYVRLGYANLSSFIQAFKLHHGTTPKQFQGE